MHGLLFNHLSLILRGDVPSFFQLHSMEINMSKKVQKKTNEVYQLSGFGPLSNPGRHILGTYPTLAEAMIALRSYCKEGYFSINWKAVEAAN